MKSYLTTLDVLKLKKFETVSDFGDLVIATNLMDPRKGRFTKLDWIKAMSQMANSKKKICFKANEGTSPVNGDSGGPGYFDDSNGDYVVTGVSSSFYYNDNKVVRGFCYNSVVNHLDWINSVMEDIRQRRANY